MQLAKLLTCFSLSMISLCMWLFIKRIPHTVRILSTILLFAIFARLILVVGLYLLFPNLNNTSDASLYYFPQGLNAIAGKIVYVDFPSNYSLFFPYLVGLPLLIWKSVGSIVLLFVTFEVAACLLYLRRANANNALEEKLALMLYLTSPLSVYWIVLTGYNGVLIAFFALVSLMLLEKGRILPASLVAVFGFSLSKLLMLLTFPGIVFSEQSNVRRKVLCLGGIFLGFTAVPFFIGLDALSPVKFEFNRMTSGNIWFLLSLLIPDRVQSSYLWKLGPVISFLALLIFILAKVKNRAIRRDVGVFDQGSLLIAAVCLLFMLVSRKTYMSYYPMMLLFVIHSLYLSFPNGSLRLVHLLPVAYLGVVTTTEPYLYQQIEHSSGHYVTYHLPLLIVIDVFIILSNVCLLWWCLRYYLIDTSTQNENTTIGEVSPRKYKTLERIM